MKSLMSVNSFQTFVGQMLLMVIALPFGIHLMSHPFAVYTSSVADSGFPRRWQPIIRPKFPENCMKMKKKIVWRWGGNTRPKFVYVDPPHCTNLFCTFVVDLFKSHNHMNPCTVMYYI